MTIGDAAVELGFLISLGNNRNLKYQGSNKWWCITIRGRLGAVGTTTNPGNAVVITMFQAAGVSTMAD